MLRYLFIIIFITTVYTDSLNRDAKPNTLDIWENENKKIKNPELKKELMKLNEEFNKLKNDIKKEYQKKITPLKTKKDNEISNLKSDYLNKRKILFEKYGVKRNPKLKERQKNKKPLPYYKKDKLKSKK